jgi:hypothetical protein
MPTCEVCGSSTSPESALWGNQCGDCVAAQIRLALEAPLVRKPVKRAAPLSPITVEIEVKAEEEQRQQAA